MEDYQYGYENENPSPNRAIKGYQIIIIVLAVILGALSFIYFRQMNSLKQEYAIERDTLTNRLMALRDDYSSLRIENDTITQNLLLERDRVDSLMESLTKERNLNRSKIRQYEKELGTLREVMRTYVHQIDSLNTLNRALITENADIRQQITTTRLRAEIAEEKADELNTRIRQGSVIRARDIALRALTNRDKETTRAKQAARLRVDFVLAANELAQPGQRPVYARITGPDGYIMTTSAGAVFDYEGEKRTYSAVREVDYQNQDLGVSLYYNGTGITDGKYRVEVYFDGHLVGSTEVVLR